MPAEDTADVRSGEMETPEETEKKKDFDHDGFWKDLIERFFYDLLKRALPELYEKADRTVMPRFLDKEFRDVLNTSDPKIHNSPHFADYVLEVPLKSGGAEWVLLHIEAQGRGGGNLAVRMRTYGSLIFVHYQREPVALVIITDRRPASEPEYYAHSHYGTESVYRYNSLVLSELDDNELLTSDNPIDIVLYAAKFSLKTKEEFRKFNFLRKVVGLLGDRGWPAEKKRDLLLFIERIVNMRDETLITQYREVLEQENREGRAMYIPLLLRDSAAEIEQRGIEKGREEGIERGIERGREEGKLEVARKLLARRIPPDIIAESTNLPLNQIQGLMN
jgi:predicted transposase/invertase (TIGR01784 family)